MYIMGCYVHRVLVEVYNIKRFHGGLILNVNAETNELEIEVGSDSVFKK
jgi:hypothetical protein